MEIQVWRSFSCNNSTSYRMVARFRDASQASDVAEELRGFLAEASPLAARPTRRDRRTPLTQATSFPISQVIDALATEHGFDWTTMLTVDEYSDDEIEIVTEGAMVLVYNEYCLGLGDGLPAYLRARGGEVRSSGAGDPTVSVLFRPPHGARALVSELSAFFEAIRTNDEKPVGLVRPPWSSEGRAILSSFGNAETIAFFDDGKTIGFYLALTPTEILEMRSYLQNAGVEQLRIRLCEPQDLVKFRTIADAYCTHCEVRMLEYFDKNEHAIEEDQLACTRCGGMFDLAAVIAMSATRPKTECKDSSP